MTSTASTASTKHTKVTKPPKPAKPTNPTEPREVLIALVGVTGAGKSTFASVASGRNDVEIGYGVDPCTQDPQAIRFLLDGHKITLIDTPGFDDDRRSDLEILEDIGNWLIKEGYGSRQLLDGLILLHPVTLNRVGGMERRRTKLLQAILGSDAYKRVLIATTMWDDLVPQAALQLRVRGRTRDGGVWGDMVGRGAVVLQHNNNQESAHNIIRHIIKMPEKSGRAKPLLLQDEMVEKKGRVKDTTLGKEMKRQLLESLELLSLRLRELEEDEPPEFWGEHADPERKQKRMDWEQEKARLVSKIERQQEQIKKLDGLVFKVKSIWSKLFGGR
ncbi:hypothetical protein OQA88_1265 [Cercophora sp. LCS_1]